MKKLVIFDMDGVLIDSEMYCYLGYRDFFKENYSIDMSLEEYGMFLAGKNPFNSLPTINEYYHIDSQVEALENYFQSRGEKNLVHPLKDGIKELVMYCHNNNVLMVIASSSNKERIKFQVGSYGILEYFTDVVSGREVPRGKPYPDVFLKACEKVNVDPQDAVVLEDSEAGLMAAISGNIDAIWIPDIARPKQEVVDKCTVLNNARDVIGYLNKD